MVSWLLSSQGFFFGVPNGTEETFSQILKKIPNFQKKKKKIFFEDWDFHLVNTYVYKLHGDILLQFNGNSMCNSYFFIDQK